MHHAELKVDAGVATISFRTEMANATLTPGLAADLQDLVAQVAASDDVRAVVLIGSGSTFIVGADVKAMAEMSSDAMIAFNEGLLSLSGALAALPVPVIAAVNGHAFGGGLELALACDLRIVDARAKLGLPEVKVGLIPGSGGSVRLPRLVGEAHALMLMLTGDPIDAVEAVRIGLVHEAVAADEVVRRAQQLARAIADRAPLAVRAAKAVTRSSIDRPMDRALEDATEMSDQLMGTADVREGLRSFIERRPPAFEGR